MAKRATITIKQVTFLTPEVKLLVSELDHELSQLYLPDQRHGLPLGSLLQNGIRFFAAWADDAPVGCGALALHSDFAEVKRMYVRPPWRGRGVADALSQRLVQEAQQSDLGLLRLETGSHSIPAVRFYNRNGFAPCEPFAPFNDMSSEALSASSFLERRSR